VGVAPHGWEANRGPELQTDVPEPSIFASEIREIRGQYRFVRLIRRSEGVETTFAVEVATGMEVVIKTAPAGLVPPELSSRLEQRARTPRAHDEQWFAPLLDVGYTEDRLYVVMPFVPGPTLEQRLAEGPLSVPESLTVAGCLLKALKSVHARGILHANVKPSNIVLSDTKHGQATLIDFGNLRGTTVATSIPAQPTGFAHYMAPELAGALNQEVDERADLYSLGAVLFECLVGHSPFASASMRDLLRKQLSTPPPSVRSLGVPVPRALDQIVQRLLHPDARQRYRSATAALTDLDAVVHGLQQGVQDPSIVVGAADQRATIAQPALIGREDELALLDHHLAEAVAGSGGLVVLEACSGGGKSRLLDEFCQRAAATGAAVFRGYGVQRVAPRPLQILSGVVTDLLAAARRSPAMTERLTDSVGDGRGALCEVVPELREILALPEGSNVTGPESFGQARSVIALVRLLDALGSPRKPAVVVLDDAHWVDELTARVLCEWTVHAPGEGEKRRHVMMVAAVRPEEFRDGYPQWMPRDAFRIALRPLAPEETAKVVESMAGTIPTEAVDTVVKLSDGNPFMASAVLLGLIEAGALRSDGRRWLLGSEPVAWQASREAAAILAGRIGLLAQPTRRLLDAAAVLGREFDVRLARSLAGLSDTETADALTQACTRHIVWSAASERYMFVHDRLREVLLSSLDPVDLTRLHLRAALEIERTEPARALDLAYHFDAAGESERAAEYALAAGKLARSRHGLEVAEVQYRIAERGTERADRATRQEVAEALGQVLMLRGRYPEAEERLRFARSLATDKVSAARLEGQLGELAFKCDDVDAAADRIEVALRLLGERVPDGGLSLTHRLARELGLRGVIVLGLRRRRAGSDEKHQLTARLLARLQYAWSFKRRRSAAVWVMLRHLNVAERGSANSGELAHSYAIHGAGVALTFPFLWRYGLNYADRGVALHHERGNLWGEAQALSMRGCVLYAARRYSEAAEHFGRAVQLLEQAGDPWELNFAAWNRALCLCRMGRLHEAAEAASSVYKAAAEIGDVLAQAESLLVQAKVAGGYLRPELVEATLRDAGADLHTRAAALQARSLELRATGRPDEALAVLEEAVTLVERSGARILYFVGVFPWLATLSREAAERQMSGQRTSAGGKEGRRVFRQARRAARRSLRYAIFYPNDLPHSLREVAASAARCGRYRRAQLLLDWSDRVATRHRAGAELTENARQRLLMSSKQHDWQDENSGRPSPLNPFQPPARPTSVALAERFATLLDAGARLISAGSAEEIAAAVRETALMLLRADRCEVARTDGSHAEDSEPGFPAGQPWRKLLVQRAIECQRPVALGGLRADDADIVDSLVLAGVKSALCAPILGRGEVVGYFLAYHFGLENLFGEDEERLAEFIAHLAGAAFEREVIRQEARVAVVAAQEAERARVARDLHDEVGQALTSFLLDVRSLEGAIRDRPFDANQLLTRIGQLRKVADDALGDVQRLAFELRPTILDDLGLVDALQRLALEVTAHNGVTVHLEAGQLGPGCRLHPDVETTAYRVVQEALTNAVRHSGASTCSVVATRSEERMRIVVEDDGVGFDPAAIETGHLGLRGMTERAQLVGGTLMIVSAVGDGATIVLEVPIV